MLYLYHGEGNPRVWDTSEVYNPMYPSASLLRNVNHRQRLRSTDGAASRRRQDSHINSPPARVPTVRRYSSKVHRRVPTVRRYSSKVHRRVPT
eukprot:1186952-Prorocentrum_minimum.AAC.1